MRHVAQYAIQTLEQEEHIVLVTICEVKGSVPCAVGAKMVVSSHHTEGTVGGGNLEYQVIDQARKLLCLSSQTSAIQSYPLGPLLKQCCGGYVTLLYEKLSHEDVPMLKEWAQMIQSSKPYQITTHIDDGHSSKRIKPLPQSHFPKKDSVIFYGKNSKHHKLKLQCHLTEYYGLTSHSVYVFGAGHIGKALIPILQTLDCKVIWVDERQGVFPKEKPNENVTIVSGNPLEEADRLPEDAIVLIFTHSHERDYQLVRTCLQSPQTVFCGLIGSQTKRARFIRRLKEDGFSPSQIDQLTCPIGLPGVTSKDPAEIAISIAAQIVSLNQAHKKETVLARAMA